MTIKKVNNSLKLQQHINDTRITLYSFVFVSVGNGHCKADEGLHQSNSEEAFSTCQSISSHGSNWWSLLTNTSQKWDFEVKRQQTGQFYLEFTQKWPFDAESKKPKTFSWQTLSCSHRHTSSYCAWNCAAHTCLFTEPHIWHCINILSPVAFLWNSAGRKSSPK